MVEQSAHEQPDAPIIRLSGVLERFSAFPIRAYEEGDVVLHERSATNRLLVLRQGVVDVVKDNVQLTQVSEPGAVFGDMGFILGRPHTADVVAAAPSSFFLIEDALALLDADPNVARYLMVVLATRLDAVNQLLIEARSEDLDPDQRPGVLEDVFARIGRALNISTRD